ncbi:hypothetical protein DFO66_103331 [Brevibacterium sanguinis]|uniref:Uncharacterized protein n=2 Tax=Brevibacterium TaxID=1696 RepID=A0A366INH4_9MICO|nr:MULTISPECIES: hypothetical protein [Brevibacterium]RBP66384.1 hypothetical protein DFO66_103331 [Brevibacterium sanguinis]RBP73036.1 hypothetical protein DFO65_103331 [Brevibacterium celere]
MSFIRITTYHPDGRIVTGVTQQVHISAQEAFDRRLARLRVAPQGFDANRGDLTIHLHATAVVEYEQMLEYAETLDGLDNHQPALPMEAK